MCEKTKRASTTVRLFLVKYAFSVTYSFL